MSEKQLTNSELIQLGYEESHLESVDDIIACEPCAELFNEVVEATHEAWNVEMCYDCYMEFLE
tara:strand:+ start:214 stop:402 length:189 start_codon:yes stop_codon:yes gene_type:complete